KSPQLLVLLISLLFVLLSQFFTYSYRTRRLQRSPGRGMKIVSVLVLLLVIGPFVIAISYSFTKGLVALLSSTRLQQSNFVSSLMLVLVPLSTTLRPTVLRRQSWKTLRE